MSRMNKKNIVAVFATMFMLILSAGCGNQQAQKDNFRVVTSFYPVYITVANITAGVEGVETVNMTEAQTGCLHDYSLTTKDMRTLENADVFVINGGGMESFLEKVSADMPKLAVISASDSDKIVMLKDKQGENPHVWLSVTYAIAQTKKITADLCEKDPSHADAYRKNALDYVMKLEKLREEMHEGLDNLPNKDIITFHEAFPYFAREFKLNIVAALEQEPGVEPSPKEVEETIEIVNKMPTKVIFTEPQYSPAVAETIARETGAKLYALDPIVTGNADENARDDYINKMKQNAAVLKEALQ